MTPFYPWPGCDKMSGMRNAVLTGFLVALFALAAAGNAAAYDNDTYFEVANAILAGEPMLEDFASLREAYARTSWYNPVPDRTSLEPLDQALETGDLETANDFINSNYFYFMPIIDFHLTAMATYRELGDTQTHEWHEWFLQRLLDSIFESGDGESAETAFFSVYEREHFIVLEIMGLEPRDRREVSSGERLLYIYEAVDETGETRDIHFDFTVAEEWRAREAE